MGMPSLMVAASVSARGGQPTGTMALATGARMMETASPRMKTFTSCPASASALACAKPKAALVGSSDPHALFTRTFISALPAHQGPLQHAHEEEEGEGHRRGH